MLKVDLFTVLGATILLSLKTRCNIPCYDCNGQGETNLFVSPHTSPSSSLSYSGNFQIMGPKGDPGSCKCSVLDHL